MEGREEEKSSVFCLAEKRERERERRSKRWTALTSLASCLSNTRGRMNAVCKMEGEVALPVLLQIKSGG